MRMIGLNNVFATQRAHHWLVATALAIAVCQAVAMDDVDDTEGALAEQEAASDTDVAVVTPGGTATISGKAHDGPSVEFITGGNSTDGAAKVGRLPVID